MASAWATSEHNQRVKVYRLTAARRKQLASERSRWERLSQAIGAILNSVPRRNER